MTVRKTTKKETAKATEPKKTTVKRTVAAKKVVVALNAENAGFKAGDVYQALAAAEKPLSATEIAKVANISTEEAFLGMGWLFKEGKIVASEDDKITLAQSILSYIYQEGPVKLKECYRPFLLFP